MTSFTRKWGWPLAACLSVLVAFGFIVKPLWGQPVPGLTISQIGSNQFQITITNAVSYASYEIYRRVSFDSSSFWIGPITGALGQAVFTVTNVNSIKQQEFFQAAVGSDWDGDGILNWQDSQPSSTNGGLLRITIDSPTSNGNVP